MWKFRRTSQKRALRQADVLSRVLSVHQSALVDYQERKYNCRVHDFDTDTISLTALIDERGLPIYLEPGTSVEITLQVDNAFYGFQSKVISSIVKEDMPIVVCARPEEVRRTDRRGYFRVPVNFSCTYQVNEGHKPCQGRVLDISGGGISFLVDAKTLVKKGDMLYVSFTLPGDEKELGIKVNVRLVIPSNMASWQRVAVEFHEITEATRESIIGYVARRQLELIRAGHLARN